jgi:SAM-dependent methyltransferase
MRTDKTVFYKECALSKRIDYYEDLTDGKDVDVQEHSRLVRENWRNMAIEHGDSPDATIRDLYARKLNTEEGAAWIKANDWVLDVGCGNGFATAEYAKRAARTIGIDYIPEFIDSAIELHAEVAKKHRLEFYEGDIRDLLWVKEQYGQFDKVFSERTLINLASWEEQILALNQLASLVKIGGHLFLLEVTTQGHESVDRVREQYGLSILEKHWNNVYMDEERVIKHLANDFQLIHKESFSLYTLLSKVLHPVLVQPAEPKFDAPINKLAYELSHSFTLDEDIGHTILLVFKKETW